MKQVIWLIIVLFISACSQNGEKSMETPTNDINEEIQENSNQDQEEVIEVEETNEEDSSLDESVEAEYEVTENWFIKPLSDANEQVVLLTIDDAPDDYALTMAKTLEKLDVSAIFFVNGHLLETDESKEVLKEISEMGFLIGNHTYSHKSLQSLSEAEQKEEILRVSDMVEEIIGERPLYFRAPFGQNTDFSKQIVEEENMTLMNWVYGYDWEKEYMTKDALTDIMINADGLGNGANLLMHDREWTSDALHDIVVGLRDKGYEILDPTLIQSESEK